MSYWQLRGPERERAKQEYLARYPSKRREPPAFDEHGLRVVSYGGHHYWLSKWGDKAEFTADNKHAIREQLIAGAPPVPPGITEDYARRVFILPDGREYPYTSDPSHRRAQLEYAILLLSKHERST